MRVLLIDNYDSFTYNLLHQLMLAGATCELVRNDAAFDFDRSDFQAAVLSPGPCTPQEAGWLMPFIEQYHQRIPLLGVCLGHQALGCYFGANLVRAQKPMHGKTSLIRTVADPWFQETGTVFEAMRYHSLVLEDLPPSIMPLAHSPEGHVMALRHATLPLYGLQFHPESVLSPVGQQLINRFLSLNDVY